VTRAGRQEPLWRERESGPQHQVNPVASTYSQRESRAAHVTAKAMFVAEESGSAAASVELPRFRGRVRAFDPSVHYLLRRRRLRAARRTARVSLQRFQFGAPPLAARRAERVTSTSRISLACATIRSRIHSATFGRRFATGCSRASASWRAPHSVSEKRRNAPCRRGCGIGGRPSRAMGF